MQDNQKQTQNKLTKGLLDLITLQLLKAQPMHGYQLITKIRKNYGVYFGPSTIYPLLGIMEKKKLLKSEWNMTGDRPKKVYRITENGISMLTFAEESLSLMCRKLVTQTSTDMTVISHDPW
jgi:PadR family transcriptional regulator, regulatory protein PadR